MISKYQNLSWIKSTESTQLNSIQTFPLTQGLLSVAAVTYECGIGLWLDLTEEMVITSVGREAMTTSMKLQAFK